MTLTTSTRKPSCSICRVWTFLAEKEEVASTAESNNAPQELLWRIRNASTQRFNYLDNVLEAVRGRRVF